MSTRDTPTAEPKHSLEFRLEQFLASRLRATILLTLLVALPVVLLGNYSIEQTRSRLYADALTTAANSAELATSITTEHLFDVRDQLTSAVAGSFEFRQAAVDKDAAKLRSFLKQWRLLLGRDVLGMNYETVDATQLASEPFDPSAIGQTFTDKDYYRGVTKSWEPYISEVFALPGPGNAPTVAIAIPVKDDVRKPVGYIVAFVDLLRASDWFSLLLPAYDDIYLINTKGELIVKASNPRQDTLKDIHTDPVVVSTLGGNQVAGQYNDPITKDKRLLASRSVAGIGWSVVMSQALSRFEAQVQPITNSLLTIGGALIGLLFLISFMVARTMSRTVRQRALLAVVSERQAKTNVELEQQRTQLAEAVEQQQASNTRLSTVNKELEQFAYSVSHDLRAPLRTISGYSEQLMEDYQDKLDDDGKHALGRIQIAIQKMSQLISEILELSRTTRAETKMEPLDFTELTEGVVAEIKEQGGVETEFVVQPDMRAVGDTSLLVNAMRNLLGNAKKFSSKNEHPKVEVGSFEKDGNTVYFVKDNGAGFDMAHADKLFQVWQRLHAQDEFEGTGIGLATVSRIMHKHGGNIRAEAEVGKGATFFFTLKA